MITNQSLQFILPMWSILRWRQPWRSTKVRHFCSSKTICHELWSGSWGHQGRGQEGMFWFGEIKMKYFFSSSYSTKSSPFSSVSSWRKSTWRVVPDKGKDSELATICAKPWRMTLAWKGFPDPGIGGFQMVLPSDFTPMLVQIPLGTILNWEHLTMFVVIENQFYMINVLKEMLTLQVPKITIHNTIAIP